METEGYAAGSFRKNDIAAVYKALFECGQPETTIVSLDEYWIKPLGQAGALRDLTNLMSQFEFLPVLVESAGDGSGDSRRYWSMPHFLDFSFYACNRAAQNVLTEIRELGSAKGRDPRRKIQEMRRALGNRENLLVYDFPIGEECACVVLEFIESFGDGISSLMGGSPATDRNVRSLTILREMVGERNPEDFNPGEPIDIDAVCNKVPIIRLWHARVSDRPKLAESHKPVINSPFKATLGGWHLAVLRGAQLGEAAAGLNILLTPKNQKARLHEGTGLPTFFEFYRDAEMKGFLDKMTGWRLETIGNYARDLIKRSEIPRYLDLRAKLITLHSKMMREDASRIGDILAETLV